MLTSQWPVVGKKREREGVRDPPLETRGQVQGQEIAKAPNCRFGAKPHSCPRARGLQFLLPGTTGGCWEFDQSLTGDCSVSPEVAGEVPT